MARSPEARGEWLWLQAGHFVGRNVAVNDFLGETGGKWGTSRVSEAKQRLLARASGMALTMENYVPNFVEDGRHAVTDWGC